MHCAALRYDLLCLTARVATAPIARVALQELNERRLTLVEGSALSERDLVRTRAQSAAAILLLADRFSPSAHQEDLGLQFQARLLARFRAPTVRVVCRRPASLHVPVEHRRSQTFTLERLFRASPRNPASPLCRLQRQAISALTAQANSLLAVASMAACMRRCGR